MKRVAWLCRKCGGRMQSEAEGAMRFEATAEIHDSLDECECLAPDPQGERLSRIGLYESSSEDVVREAGTRFAEAMDQCFGEYWAGRATADAVQKVIVQVDSEGFKLIANKDGEVLPHKEVSGKMALAFFAGLVLGRSVGIWEGPQ